MKDQNIQFNKADHTYIVNGSQAELSVTQFIGQYHDDFDVEAVLDKLEINNPIIRAEKEREWAVSGPEGTLVHSVLEAYVNKLDIVEGLSEAGYAEIPIRIQNGITALKQLDQQLGSDWEWTAEWKGSFTTLDNRVVAGTVDLILVNHKLKEIILVDYKTCKSLTKNAYGKKFYEPIPKTPDSKFHKYSLQQQIYGHMAQLVLPSYHIKSKLLLQLKPTGEVVWHKCKDMKKEFVLIS